MHEAKANQRRIEVEKQEAEHSLRCFRDEGQLMVDNERRRIERELSFKKSHEDYIEQFGASVRAQVFIQPGVTSKRLWQGGQSMHRTHPCTIRCSTP